MTYLNQNQVLKLHKRIIKEFGGINGIRNETLLESALTNPLQTFTGQDLYPTILVSNFKISSSHRKFFFHVFTLCF